MATSLQMEEAYKALERIQPEFDTTRGKIDELILKTIELNRVVYGPKGSIYELIYKNLVSIYHGGGVVSTAGAPIAISTEGLGKLMEYAYLLCKEVNKYISDQERNLVSLSEEWRYQYLYQSPPKLSKIFTAKVSNDDTWDVTTSNKVETIREEIVQIARPLMISVDKIRDEIKYIRQNGIEIEQINYEGISIIAEDSLIDGVRLLIETINKILMLVNQKVSKVEELNEGLTEEQRVLLDAIGRVDKTSLPSDYYYKYNKDTGQIEGTIRNGLTIGSAGAILPNIDYHEVQQESLLHLPGGRNNNGQIDGNGYGGRCPQLANDVLKASGVLQEGGASGNGCDLATNLYNKYKDLDGYTVDHRNLSSKSAAAEEIRQALIDNPGGSAVVSFSKGWGDDGAAYGHTFAITGYDSTTDKFYIVDNWNALGVTPTGTSPAGNSSGASAFEVDYETFANSQYFGPNSAVLKDITVITNN